MKTQQEHQIDIRDKNPDIILLGDPIINNSSKIRFIVKGFPNTIFHKVVADLKRRSVKPDVRAAKNKYYWEVDSYRQIHGDLYDYPHKEWINNSTHREIYCSKHEMSFLATPSWHKQGLQCPKCANEKRKGRYESIYKHDPKYKTNIYLMELTGNDEHFFKIGLSNNPEVRKRGLSTYKVRIIATLSGTVEQLKPLEEELLAKVSPHKYVPKLGFHNGGEGECFC